MERELFRPSKWLMLILSLTIILGVSCEDDPLVNEQDLRISIQSGDGQSERTGATLPEQLVVRVT
ncbi:MAG TPA: hypothetical protein VLA34_09585, partial [Candidatus Krumholzibacterium sp.]|nr:hypothetical protein [Candidatus Krumholzibacterium sp.]